MQKKYFPFILVICIFAFGTMGCKKPSGPSQLDSYKAIDDELVTGVANLAGYEDYTADQYAVWIDCKAYFEAGGYQSNFNLSYWPGADVFPENKDNIPGGVDNYYDVFKKDAAGFYLISKAGKNTIVPLIKKGKNYWSYFTEAFGSFTCSETDNELLKNRIQYCLCFDPSNL